MSPVPGWRLYMSCTCTWLKWYRHSSDIPRSILWSHTLQKHLKLHCCSVAHQNTLAAALSPPHSAMFMLVDDIPKKKMNPGHGKLPLRDGNEIIIKKEVGPRSPSSRKSIINAYQNQASNRTQQTPHAPPQPSPGASGGLQFINLLGTEKHDTQGRNTVRSHARRHAWKHQKQQKDQKEVLAANLGNQSKNKPRKSSKEKAKSLPPTPNHGDQFYDQCSRFREVAEMLPQRSHSSSPIARQRGQGVFASLPPQLAKCAETAIAMISSPSLNNFELKNGHSDPFDVFPIPLTPRLHHLIHYCKSSALSFDYSPPCKYN